MGLNCDGVDGEGGIDEEVDGEGGLKGVEGRWKEEGVDEVAV